MPNPLAINDIRSSAMEFVRDWRDAPGYEEGDAAPFVIKLFQVFGVDKAVAGVFELQARRASRNYAHGRIDALTDDVIIEMKSAGKDLVEAEQQAIDYLPSLPKLGIKVPRFILTSDFKKFRLLDTHSPHEPAFEFTLDELPNEIERLQFLAGYEPPKLSTAQQEDASIKAAKIMGGLYRVLESSGYPDEHASVFMVRILFCLYADDAGVWPRDRFADFILSRTASDGSDLGDRLATLFQWLDREKRPPQLDEKIANFPYVNGGLFRDRIDTPAFDRKMRDALLAACEFNWSRISPAIFGSLFQAVKDKKARDKLGEHYTTETNILKLINPMFMDELHARFDAGRNEPQKLEQLRADMGLMRFLDPACGCGNFLVIAYREMRALDLAILERLQELDPRKWGRTAWFDAAELPVKLANFHGIEIEDWPARIAETALHLVEHQANQAMEAAIGGAPPTLPLDKVKNITVANALRTDWADVMQPSHDLYVFGNPPFLGHASREEEQAQELRAVWSRKDIGRLDYVTGWYAKALDLFRRNEYAGEFAFVSTNSITQGEPVPALFGPVFADGWRISFAHRTFAWSSEAPGQAAVHCVIVGFDRRTAPAARVFEYADLKGDPAELPVHEQLNGYLVDGPLALVEQRSSGPLAADLPPMVFGNTPRDGGALIVEPDAYPQFAADPVAAKYLRRLVGAQELIHNEPRWCLWMVDLDPADLGRSRLLKDRAEQCRAWRLASKAKQANDAAATPHLFWYRSHRDVPHLVVPSVSSEGRRFLGSAHFGPEVISSNLNYTSEDPDGLAFAVISSSAFMEWLRSTGGKLESRLRFSNTQVWNTFPLPRLTPELRAEIISAGQAVLDARALHPERSLADHYNPLAMAPELLKAHAQLDRAVDAVFGLKNPTNDQRLAALFDSYMRLTDG